MSKKLIIANWKMNPASLGEAKKIFLKVKRKAAALKKTSAIICPPFLYVNDLVKTAGRTKGIFVGAQNCFWENSGSFTGETSPEMLKSLGVKYVILGHSERRELGETDEMIGKKVSAVLKQNLKPVICIGEKERNSQGSYFEFVKNQLMSALSGVSAASLSNLILVYEPVWAISKGKANSKSLSGRDIQEMIIFIKKIVSDMYSKDKPSALSVPILYGGSVSPESAREILTEGQADGLLVGRDSLNAENFVEILDIADKISNF